MNAVQPKPTIKDLRAEAQRLGITAESLGYPVDDLVRRARENEDPLAYLAIYASPAAAETEAAKGETTEMGVISPIGPIGPIAGEPLAEPPLPPPNLLTPVPSTVTIAVPFSSASLDHCYISTHVDAQLSHQQGLALRRLHLGLDAAGARLANGRRVATPPDAVRWMLEQVGGSGQGSEVRG